MKKIGVGTSSILLVAFAYIWSFSFGLKGFCLGDTILTFLGIPAWSNGNSGTHYTIFYAIIFLIPALFVSIKYDCDLFAGTAKLLSAVFALFLLIGLFFMAI